MNIYSVKILFRYETEESDRAIYEERVCLFRAESFEQARQMAESTALSQEFEYYNVYARNVKFRYYCIAEDYLLFDALEFENGTEVFSTHFEMKNPHDDPVEKRYQRCSVEDMYIIRNSEYNGLWIDYEPEND